MIRAPNRLLLLVVLLLPLIVAGDLSPAGLGHQIHRATRWLTRHNPLAHKAAPPSPSAAAVVATGGGAVPPGFNGAKPSPSIRKAMPRPSSDGRCDHEQTSAFIKAQTKRQTAECYEKSLMDATSDRCTTARDTMARLFYEACAKYEGYKPDEVQARIVHPYDIPIAASLIVCIKASHQPAPDQVDASDLSPTPSEKEATEFWREIAEWGYDAVSGEPGVCASMANGRVGWAFGQKMEL